MVGNKNGLTISRTIKGFVLKLAVIVEQNETTISVKVILNKQCPSKSQRMLKPALQKERISPNSVICETYGFSHLKRQMFRWVTESQAMSHGATY